MMSPGDSVPFDATWYPSKTTHDVMGQGLICVTPPLFAQRQGEWVLLFSECQALVVFGGRQVSFFMQADGHNWWWIYIGSFCLFNKGLVKHSCFYLRLTFFWRKSRGTIYLIPIHRRALVKKKKGGLADSDKLPPTPPQLLSNGCGKKALVLINMKTRCFARGHSPSPWQSAPPMLRSGMVQKVGDHSPPPPLFWPIRLHARKKDFFFLALLFTICCRVGNSPADTLLCVRTLL